MVSSTLKMKHAERLGALLEADVEPHQGELNAAIWWGGMWVSSASKVSASSSVAEVGRIPHPVGDGARRPPIICWTECSRVGEPSWPRKYFWATMLVAFRRTTSGNW